MKANYLLFAMSTLTTLLLVSCNNDDTKINTNDEIRVSSVVEQSRSINQSLQSTQFAPGAAIGVFVTDNKTTPTVLYANRELTADGAGALAVKLNENMYYGPNDKVHIYAYYPYNASTLLTSTLNFSVKTDQSSDANFKASDLMYGTPTANPVKRTTSAVNINFSHRLSKVIVQLTSGAGSPDLKGAVVNILNTLPTTTLNIKTGGITTAFGATTTIKMVSFANNATTFDCSAVVVPQTVSRTTQLIEVLLADGGKLYYNAPDGGITFSSGKSYLYKITVNLTELIVTSTITDWIPATGDDDGEATMPDATID